MSSQVISRAMRAAVVVPAALVMLAAMDHARAAVGRTPGVFEVSASGSATYDIPLWVPPGANGLTPLVALSYNSRAKSGPIGPGWSISGLSSITRCGKTFAQDGDPAAISLTYNDRFCLDGQRLRLTSSDNLGLYGQAGTTYQTEVANFSHVVANGAAGNGPASFTVYGKDGRTYEYGAAGNSQVLATGSSTASAWLLNRITDRYSNSIVISYLPPSAARTGITVPATISWAPTSAGGGSYSYHLQFSYGSNSTQGSVTGYVAGTAVINQDLLTSVTVSNAAGTVLRHYALGYDTSATTSFRRLTSVTECADAAASNCLSPTSIGYQNGQGGVSTTTSPIASGGTYSDATTRYDFNGDGYPDLLYQDGANWFVALGGAGGFGSPFATGITTGVVGRLKGELLVDDFTNSGADGLLTNSGGVWTYFTWNGSGFSGTSTGLAVSANISTFQLADVNGDGRRDLVSLTCSNPNTTVSSCQQVGVPGARIFVNYNISGVGAPALDGTRHTAWQDPNVAIWSVGIKSSGNFGPVRTIDFNGDGREDLTFTVSYKTTPTVPLQWREYQLISGGGAWSPSFTTAQVGSNSGTGVTATVLNWNSDACTDYILRDVLHIAGCNGAMAASLAIGYVPTATMDWDGDGRTDLVGFGGNPAQIQVQLSTGAGIAAPFATGVPYLSSSYFAADIDADGLDDLVRWQTNTLSYFAHNGAGQRPDLVSSITDGFGIGNVPSYDNIPQIRSGPISVVGRVTASDGTGATYLQTYTYTNPRFNLQGRGFLGFETRRVSDSRSDSLVRLTTYETNFPNTFMVKEDRVYQHDGVTPVSTTISTMNSTTLSSSPYNERHFPHSRLTTDYRYEVGGVKNAQLITTSQADRNFDGYGNLTNLTTTITDNDSASPHAGQAWTSAVVTDFTPNASTWCVGLPTEQRTTNTAPGVPAITRTTRFTPNYSICRHEQRITEPNSATYAVTQTFGFDAFGNINRTDVTGSGMPTRTSHVYWGTTGQFPRTLTNVLNQVTVLDYDTNLGVRTSETDPNGLTTSTQFDEFSRRRSETRPDGTSTTWTLLGCPSSCPSPTDLRYWIQQIDRTNGSALIRETRSFFDGLDRLRFKQEQGLDGSFVYSVHRGFDARGRMVLDYVPSAAESAPYAILGYDPVGRVRYIDRPISAAIPTLQRTQYDYAGRTTVTTDPQQKTSTRVETVIGTLRRTRDHDGYQQELTYDAFGSLLSVTDSLSNGLLSATYDYGLGAFQRTHNDMDLGLTTYTYNALGEQVTAQNAKGQTSVSVYDLLSRPTQLTQAEGVTTWVWGTDAAARNIGRLTSVTSPSYVETFTYDGLGRASRKSIQSNGGLFHYDYTYNGSGQLERIYYPTSTSSYRLTLEHLYQYGHLQQVKDFNSSTVFWRANEVNPRGQVTQETLGNGVVTRRSFDAVTGWLSSIQSGHGGGALLQNESYLTDLVGNVTQRQNNNRGLTENFYYDNLYRLDYSQLGSVTNLDLSYDPMGNITSRSDVASGATWSYHATKKHAVTQAGTNTYSYDANGNVQMRNGHAIVWSSNNYPLEINGAGKKLTFQYDAHRRRLRQVYTNGSAVETTQYIGELLERVTLNGVDDWRHYVRAGTDTVAVISRKSSGEVVTHYMLEDHQGSPSQIVKSDAMALVGESFTAFGARRDPANWSGPCPCPDLSKIASVTRMGYTGHVAIGGQSMGLNHMNGRVQDAITGRFLSADPFVGDPEDTQSYNRYSYVSNNPLSFRDPSGFYQMPMIQRPYDMGPDEPRSTFDMPGFSSAATWLSNWQSRGNNVNALINFALNYRIVPVRHGGPRDLPGTLRGNFLDGILMAQVAGASDEGTRPQDLDPLRYPVLPGVGEVLWEAYRQAKERQSAYRTYITYVLHSPTTDAYYVGRASARGVLTAEQVFSTRYANWELRVRGFTEHTIDVRVVGYNDSYRKSEEYKAIRGREQQLLDYHHNLGHDMDNEYRGISPLNRRCNSYHNAANRLFPDSPLAPRFCLITGDP